MNKYIKCFIFSQIAITVHMYLAEWFINGTGNCYQWLYEDRFFIVLLPPIASFFMTIIYSVQES